jgi:hypothetical protein
MITIERLCLDDCIKERDALRALSAELLAALKRARELVSGYTSTPWAPYISDIDATIAKAEKLG